MSETSRLIEDREDYGDEDGTKQVNDISINLYNLPHPRASSYIKLPDKYLNNKLVLRILKIQMMLHVLKGV